jgi:hypothetical protein
VDEMETVIKQTLHTIEAEEQVRILYACESGSRAWGERERSHTRFQVFPYTAAKFLIALCCTVKSCVIIFAW